MKKGAVWFSLVLFPAAIVLTGCHTTPMPIGSGSDTLRPAGNGSADEPLVAKTDDTNSLQGQGGLQSGDLNGAALTGLEPVFFAFDRSEIQPDQVPVLEEDAAWLRQNASARATIEGHCDERGTEEYNLALGERRASATR